MSRSTTSLVVLTAMILAACDSTISVAPVDEVAAFSATPNAAAVHRYEVTVTNLTTGQNLGTVTDDLDTNLFLFFNVLKKNERRGGPFNG